MTREPEHLADLPPRNPYTLPQKKRTKRALAVAAVVVLIVLLLVAVF